MHQVQNRKQQERLVRRLALGGVGPRRAWGAVEGGELFNGGGDAFSSQSPKLPLRIAVGLDFLPLCDSITTLE